MKRTTGAPLRVLWGTCALAGLLALGACSGDDDADGPVVDTAAGAVRGLETGHARAFLGIPYAAPPVGARRWAAPAPVAPWTGQRDATQLAPHCAQGASLFGIASTSEDCLYLNVHTPRTPGPHPVMVWIHGGAFYLGQSDTYRPDALVAQGMVVVTINYRLGALGFLSHPALSAERSGASGNYGLMDQQKALEWVQANIARFGGDKANVTIFGESAGGFSVNAHLVAAGSRPLFHKAIAMSGAYPFAFGQDTLAAAEAKGAALATGTPCEATPTAACLRGLPLATLLERQMAVWPGGPVPSVDGAVLTQSVQAAFAAGAQAKVPVIQGTTRDEWRLFVGQAELATGTPVTAATYLPTITATLGPAVAAAAPLYPVVDYPNASVALGAIGTDAVFACTGRAATRLLALGGNEVYAYEFNDPTAPQTLPGTLSFSTGAAHTSELQYLFTLGTPLSGPQRTLSEAMVGYWTRFARTGDPNGGVTPAWPRYTLANDTYQALAPTVTPFTGFADVHRCATWTPGA